MDLLQPTVNHRQTQAFGANPNMYPYDSNGHDGVDYGAVVSGVEGDQLFAVDDAIVLESQINGGYGNWVKLKLTNHSDIEVAYGHVRDFNVKVGQSIKMGDIVGFMGNTGISSAAHLHFIMWIDGKKVDASKYLTVNIKDMEKLEKIEQEFQKFKHDVFETLKKHGEDITELRDRKIGKKRGLKLFKKK